MPSVCCWLFKPRTHELDQLEHIQRRCVRVTVYGYYTIIDVSQCGVAVLPFRGDVTTLYHGIVQSIPTCESVLFMTTLQQSSLAALTIINIH